MISKTIKKVLSGDVAVAARLMRELDDGNSAAKETLKRIYRHTGHAHIVGITGAPGAGKSSLVDKLIKAARKSRKTVGVVAVDPTSPFSGGAVLGDRIRMQQHATDKNVFIRSLAARGSTGGLSKSVFDTASVMDAMGKDFIFIETSGVGQDGVKIAGAAHTVLIVLSPGQGDDIQAIKSGILEIGDLFVVNKRDCDGSDALARSLLLSLGGRPQKHGWDTPVIKTNAVSGEGTEELLLAINSHRESLTKSKMWGDKTASMARAAFLELIEIQIKEQIDDMLTTDKDWKELLEAMDKHREDPHSASKKALRLILRI